MTVSVTSHYSESTTTEFDDNMKYDYFDSGSNAHQTNNCFDLPNFSFYGRNEELHFLHIIYNNVCEGGKQVSVPIIVGLSGTGKSALVGRFIDDISCDENKLRISSVNNDKNMIQSCHFLCGKFSETKCEDPFSAIVEAFSGFLLRLQADKEALDSFQKISNNKNDTYYYYRSLHSYFHLRFV